MEDALYLEIVTPKGIIINEKVDYVGIPGSSGELGILPDHIPLLSSTLFGEVYYRQGTSTTYLFTREGFVEVSNNKVSILVESAEKASEIDIERAKKAKIRAEERIQHHEKNTDIPRAQIALQRAMMRIHIAKH